jgi:hypothetical protein
MSEYLSKAAISQLHTGGLGRKGTIYIDEQYNVYEGVENGRIRLLQRASNTLIKNSSKNVNTEIIKLQNQIAAQGTNWSPDFIVLIGSTTVTLSFLSGKSNLGLRC